MARLNIGCGQTPTKGWVNYDNSWSVRLAKMPILVFFLDRIGILHQSQKEFIFFCRRVEIRWADASRVIPESDRSVEVLYSSHMIEHMNKDQALSFLKEARRVLVPGGIIRLAVPNIRYQVDNYLRDNDADSFIEKTLLATPRPKSLMERIKHLVAGERNHQWMYDGDSLCKLLKTAGFPEPEIMEPGMTKIKDPGELNLREREPDSVFVEALNP